MKPVIAFLCVAVLCAHVDSYPGIINRPNEESEGDDVAEVYIVPMERRRAVPQFPTFADSDEIGPVIRDRDYGLTPFFFNPTFAQRNNDFDGFLASMQAMLLKMRQEMDEMMHRLPPVGSDAESDTRIGFSDDTPLQNKSTSTTKVVDGHVVTVNETQYVNGDDQMSAVFRIKVVEVKPTEKSSTDKVPTEDSTENAETPSENADDKNENVDNSNDENNEIPTEKVNFSEWDSAETFGEPHPSLNEIDVDNSVEVFDNPHAEKVIDLSRDTLVNKYLSDQQEKQGLVMIDPDAELIDFSNKEAGAYYHYSPQAEAFQRLEEQKPDERNSIF